MPLYIAQSGDLDRLHGGLTHSLTTLKDRATQLHIKYKSGALVTQISNFKFVPQWCKISEIVLADQNFY